MKQVPAGEIGFHRNASGDPPVREADGSGITNSVRDRRARRLNRAAGWVASQF
jgi:hypothetical protein